MNAAVAQDLPVRVAELALEHAQAAGAVAQFGEKYGSVVRVVDIAPAAPGATAAATAAGAAMDAAVDAAVDAAAVLAAAAVSRELCGGTHVRSTGQVRPFKLLSEGSVAAGTRRIEVRVSPPPRAAPAS